MRAKGVQAGQMLPFSTPAPTENTLRVCAYARVSTDKDDQANSYESQVRYFTEYIRQHPGWSFAGTYADEGSSGTNTKKRDGFNRMIEDAENGLIDLILTKEVSRFARNTVDTLSITRELKRHGVSVLFLNDNISTADNDGELRLSIMATIAQDESRKTSERVKWGQKRRMEQGVVFGRDLLGYSVRGGKLYLKEEEAETVRLIFHKFTDEGKGTHVIARELREAGIRPVRAAEWSNTVILRVLRNEKYVGDLCQKKTYTPDYLDHGKKYNRGAEEKVYIRDHHPDIAIIGRDLWERTQEELERRSPSEGQKARHSNRYWCSGKLACGDCGGPFVSRSRRLKNGGVYRAWRCRASANHGRLKTDACGNRVGCTGRSIGDRTLRLLTAAAIDMVGVDRQSMRQRLLRMAGAWREPDGPPDRRKLAAKIAALQQKKLRIIDLAAEGLISKEDLRAQTGLYAGQIEKLAAQLAGAESREPVPDAQPRQLQRYADRVDTLLRFDADSDGVLHEALQKAVVYSDGRVDLYLNGLPFGIRMRYRTEGRLDTFGVEVLSCELLGPGATFTG